MSDLRKLAEAATPGLWVAVGMNEPDDTVCTIDDDPICHAHPDDTRYIAAVSPEVVIGLLDRIDALRAVLGELAYPTRGLTSVEKRRVAREALAADDKSAS